MGATPQPRYLWSHEPCPRPGALPAASLAVCTRAGLAGTRCPALASQSLPLPAVWASFGSNVSMRDQGDGAGAAPAPSTFVPRVPNPAWLCLGWLSLQPTSCTSFAPLHTSILHRACSGHLGLMGRCKTQATKLSHRPGDGDGRLSSLSMPIAGSTAGKAVTSRKRLLRETATSPLGCFPRIRLHVGAFPSLCPHAPAGAIPQPGRGSSAGSIRSLRRARGRGGRSRLGGVSPLNPLSRE